MLQQRLKECRKAKGLTQADIADVLHIAPNTYNMIENGKTKLDTERIFVLCNLYDISPEVLFNSGVKLTFSDKVENSYTNYIQTLYTDNQQAIGILKEQMSTLKEQLTILQQTITLLLNKL